MEEKELELLDENRTSDLNNLNNIIFNLYIHMIKYKYCEQWQDSDWPKSIKDRVEDLNKFFARKNKNNLSRDLNLEYLLFNARIAAAKEVEAYRNTLAEMPEHPVDKLSMYGSLDWLNLDDIYDKFKIVTWLNDNKKDDSYFRSKYDKKPKYRK